MEINIYNRFTAEAKSLFDSYIEKVKEFLRVELADESEINESIEEISNHLLDYCTHMAGNDSIITTDILKQGIKKLGDPKIIGQVLADELELYDQLVKDVAHARPNEVKVTAVQAIQAFQTMSILFSTFGILFSIFQIADQTFSDLFAIHLIFFLLSAIWRLVKLRNRKIDNTYLDLYLSFGSHQLIIVPVVISFAIHSIPIELLLVETFLFVFIALLPSSHDYYREIAHKAINFVAG